MVARGFKNDNPNTIPRAYNPERRQVIGKVMARGGIVRQVLAREGVEIDPATWQGRSGVEVAKDLFSLVKPFIEALPEGSVRDRIDELEAQFWQANSGQIQPEVVAWQESIDSNLAGAALNTV